MAVNQLGYLGFGVSDMSKWEDYATRVLGLEISDRGDDGTVYLRMDEHHHRISLHEDPVDDLTYVGWQAANREEFEATKAALYESGIEFMQGSREELSNRHVIDMVKFNLSGITQEVYYGPHFLFERAFQPAVPVSGFRTADFGMGHVGMTADDADEMIRILTQCLGLKISDSLGQGGERFLHVNGREHSAVVGQARPEGGKRIGHFMLEVNSLEDVGLCLDRVEEAEVPIRARFGKHTNDHMKSFYMVSPSGFGIEYGFNGRTIDDSTWQVGRYERASIWGHRRANAGTPETPMPARAQR